MTLLDILPGEYRKTGRKNGGEYAGACPWCGDGGKGRTSDRFHVWPEQGKSGTYWCRMCGKAGDAIKYLIDHDGLDFKAAIARLGLSAADIVKPNSTQLPRGWQPSSASQPAAIWAEHAEKFVAWCQARLAERPLDLAWLAERGIGPAMVEKYRLGYNPTHAWRERPAWGLAQDKKEDGKLKKLWLPRGLVIPMFGDQGQVLRLRIRQPDGSPRYMVIPGSSREPLCSRAAEAMIIVESELDAILLDGLAGDVAGIVAMGNDTAKPTERLLPLLSSALHISVAMDSDSPRYNEQTGNMDLPGGRASRWWLEQFPQAVRVPIVGGKDPGEALAAGVDLRLWVLAALPAYFHVKADLLAEKARRIKENQEKAAAEARVAETMEETAPEPPQLPRKSTAKNPDAPLPADEPQPPRIVTLKNGRSFYLAADRAEWDRLSAAGQVVFSEYELQRLQAACQKMSPDERLVAAMQVLDVKEVFGNSWIKRGEAATSPQEQP